jgi:hypothetical protein
VLRNDREYLWLVEASGVFAADVFSRVFARMLDEAQEKLDRLASRQSSAVFTVVESFDVGPRDMLGRPTGNPQRSTDV